jgi:hypothetical protein
MLMLCLMLVMQLTRFLLLKQLLLLSRSCLDPPPSRQACVPHWLTLATVYSQLASLSSYPKIFFSSSGKQYSKNPRRLSLQHSGDRQGRKNTVALLKRGQLPYAQSSLVQLLDLHLHCELHPVTLTPAC